MLNKLIITSFLVVGLMQVQAAPIENPIEIPVGVVNGTILIAGTALHLYGVHKLVDYLEKRGKISSQAAFYAKSYDKARSALITLWALSHFSDKIPFRISGGMPLWVDALLGQVMVNTPLFELSIVDGLTDTASIISKVPSCMAGIFEATKDVISRIRIV